ncbi:MAG TPA: hypothetical protein DEV81_07030 [Cyanobacteria bacterium UBA11049]|nr:hypothetical protein [Cyanobacteria bacterium UBA11049]
MKTSRESEIARIQAQLEELRIKIATLYVNSDCEPASPAQQRVLSAFNYITSAQEALKAEEQNHSKLQPS